jgi:lysine 2,3-aminomutase
VRGVEDLRTTLATALHLEKNVRGTTAGFNTPTFVIDAPGGGGKRDVHSFEYYDRETGISVFTSPAVRKDALYLYFDPLHALSPSAQRRWQDPVEQEAMTRAAIARVRGMERPFSEVIRSGARNTSFTVEEQAWP